MSRNRRWKQAERRHAAYFGSKRTILSGSNSRGSSSDTEHPELFIEIKQRENHGVWNWWEKAKTLAKKEAKTPIVLLDKVRCHGAILCVHLDDLDDFLEAFIRTKLSPEEFANRLEKGWPFKKRWNDTESIPRKKVRRKKRIAS